MEVSRRSFFKRGILMGAAPLAATAAQCARASGTAGAKPVYKLTDVKETTNICCYCSGGCGTICSTRNGELINLEGDPDHPVNVGGLCPKGAAMWGLRNIVTPKRKSQLHPDRVLTPLVRRPGSKTWEKISWDEAIDAIAKRIKKTRDASFVESEDGITVNRCDGIASFGAAQLNNEEGWLVQKFARSLGIVAIDDHHVLDIFGHRGFHLPTVADSLGIRLAGAVRGSGKRDHLEPRVILKQRDKTLTDHTGGTKDADLQFFGHDDLYDLWVSMDYLRRTAVMRVAVKQCNCTKHAEQRQWSSQMVAAQ